MAYDYTLDTAGSTSQALTGDTWQENAAEMLASLNTATNSAATNTSQQTEIDALLGDLLGIIDEPSDVDFDAAAAAAAAAAGSTASSNQDAIVDSIPEVSDALLSAGETIDAYLMEFMQGALDEFAPGWQDMLEAGTQAAVDVSDFANDFVTNYYPDMAANMTETAGLMTDQANSLLQGEMPADVLAAVRRGSAEQAVAGLGMSGETSGGTASRNLQARDLGLTSLDLIAMGGTLGEQASGVYGGLTSIASATTSMLGSAASVANQGSSAISQLLPGSSLEDWMSGLSSLTSQLSSQLTDPSDIASLYAEFAQMASEYDWTTRLSEMNALTGMSAASMGSSSGSSMFG